MNRNKVFTFLTLFILLSFVTNPLTYGQIKTEKFAFEYNGNKLSGFLDFPDTNEASTLIIIIPGSGPDRFCSFTRLRFHTSFIRKTWNCCLFMG